MDAPIVTLTTDWSAADFFVGRVKGRLLSLIPNVRIIDISHSLPVADRMAASFVVSNACREFPKGTIHIVDVANQRINGEIVVVEADGQYYILLNNGLPYMVFGNRFERAVQVSKETLPDMGAFLAYDIYCQIAAKIAGGTDLGDLGEPCKELQAATPFSYISTRDPNNGDQLKIYITYIDDYGNIYLGITHDEFEQIRAGRSFVLKVRNKELSSIASTQDMQKEEPMDALLTVATTGHLMVTFSQACENASRLLGLNVKDVLTVTFK